jgi:hypothetical protein
MMNFDTVIALPIHFIPIDPLDWRGGAWGALGLVGTKLLSHLSTILFLFLCSPFLLS